MREGIFVSAFEVFPALLVGKGLVYEVYFFIEDFALIFGLFDVGFFDVGKDTGAD